MSLGHNVVEQLFLDLTPDIVYLHVENIQAIEPWVTQYVDAIKEARYGDAIWARYHMFGEVSNGMIEGLTVMESITQDAMGYKKNAPEQYAEAVSLYKGNSSADGHTDVIEIIMRVDVEDLTGKYIPENFIHTGSSVATALGAGLAAMILYCVKASILRIKIANRNQNVIPAIPTERLQDSMKRDAMKGAFESLGSQTSNMFIQVWEELDKVTSILEKWERVEPESEASMEFTKNFVDFGIKLASSVK